MANQLLTQFVVDAYLVRNICIIPISASLQGDDILVNLYFVYKH